MSIDVGSSGSRDSLLTCEGDECSADGDGATDVDVLEANGWCVAGDDGDTGWDLLVVETAGKFEGWNGDFFWPKRKGDRGDLGDLDETGEGALSASVSPSTFWECPAQEGSDSGSGCGAGLRPMTSFTLARMPHKRGLKIVPK